MKPPLLFAGNALLFVFLSALNVHAARPDIAGSFVYVPERSTSVEKALEKAVAKTSFVIRPIARSRLTKTNKPYQAITFLSEPGKLGIVTDRRAPTVAPDDGKPVKWAREDGEVLDVSMKRQGTGVRETFAASDGKRVNEFELSADGRELRMNVTVSSRRLPEPLTYTLVYQRQ